MLREQDQPKIAARNGCRFAKSAARDGPTRSIAVNQRMFVSDERADDRERERSPDAPRARIALLASCGEPATASRIAADRRARSALIRNGE